MTFVLFVGVLIMIVLPSTIRAEIDDDLDLMCSELSCDDFECPDTEDCEFGVAPDICNCCFICAKGPGHHCGGMLNLAGHCGDNLVCLRHPKYPQLPGTCASL